MATISGTTWPARAAASPWAHMTLRPVPRRASDKPIPMASDKPILRAAAKPKPCAEVDGIALRFNLVIQAATGEVVFAHYALDRSIARIRAGREVLALTRGHGGEVIATSADGCLEVWRDGDILGVSVRGVNRAGRRAIAALRESPFRALSVGVDRQDVVRSPDLPGDTMIVVKGRLYEIAVVAEGACPGALFLA